MMISVPEMAIEGATGEGAEVIANPPLTPASTDYLGGMFNLLLPVGTAIAKAKTEQFIAQENAKTQAKINSYHKSDPSVGPNDPRAALAYAAQTPAQKFLPSFMLAPATTQTLATGEVIAAPQKVSGLGWVLLIGGGLLGILILVRLIRR